MKINFVRLLSMLKLLRITVIATTIMAASVFIDSLTSTTSAQTNKDSTEVLAQVDKYLSVWNTRDVAALAKFFTVDADFIMGNQPRINGRVAIQNWWQNYFNRQEPERKLIIAVNSLRIIVPGVVIINVGTTTGGKSKNGKDLTTRKFRGTWMLIRQNGDWLITGMYGIPTENDQIIRNLDMTETEVEGVLIPAGPPLEKTVKTDTGEFCIIELKQPYKISGTLSGGLEIDYRILVYGPYGEPPGTYNEEWIAFGSFSGTVDDTPAGGKFTYTARVKVGGDVEGIIVFGQGIKGELIIKGNFKDGKLSYNGHLD